MTATEQNRQLVEHMFSELANGNPAAFAAALADDVRWHTPGHSIWSRTFHGKRAVLDDLLGPVRAQLVERVRLAVLRIIADGDHVVVEAKGSATTKTGKPYNNEYCFVFRVADGKVAAITEYLDTELAAQALVAPWASTTTAASPGA